MQTQVHTLAFTPMSPSNLMCIWAVGGILRTRAEPMQAQGEHAYHTQKGPKPALPSVLTVSVCVTDGRVDSNFKSNVFVFCIILFFSFAGFDIPTMMLRKHLTNN